MHTYLYYFRLLLEHCLYHIGFSYSGRDGPLRLFQEVPEPPSRLYDLSGSSMFVLNQRLSKCFRFASNIVVDAIPPLRVAILAARLNEQLVHAPVVQVLNVFLISPVLGHRQKFPRSVVNAIINLSRRR